MVTYRISSAISNKGIWCGKMCTFIELTEAPGWIETDIHLVDFIVHDARIQSLSRIVICGDEPLRYMYLENLLSALLKIDNVEINIETNGLDLIDYNFLGSSKDSRISITLLWKCKSTRLHDKMQHMNICYMTYVDSIIFDVHTFEDLIYAKDLITNSEIEAQIFILCNLGSDEQVELAREEIAKSMKFTTQIKFQQGI